MLMLILGLILFFGMHSVSIYALPLRDSLAARNELGWKVFYALVSIFGFVLIIKGYGEFRQTANVLYTTPLWMRHLAALLLLPVFILFLAPYFPGRIKTITKHPQLISVKLWALAHLLVNGSVADVLLFGSFLVWAVIDRISMKKRKTRPVVGLPKSNLNDGILVVLGLIFYVIFTLRLHSMWIGVKPFAV